MAQSHPPLSILVGTQQLRISGDAPPSAEGQDDYGMGGESSPESTCSFGMNGLPSPIAQHDFGMGGSLSLVAWHDSRMGGSPSPMAPGGHGMGLPLPTVARQRFWNPLAAHIWEWGKCAPPSSASEVSKGHGITDSEVLQEVGDCGSFGMDRPPSPAAQDNFGMDLALPTEAGEHVRIPSEAHTKEVETWDNFGMDAPPSPMAQDDFGMDSPISPRVHAQGTVPAPSQQDELPDEGIGADLALPTEAGEHHIRIPLAACTINWDTHALSPIDSQIQEGQVRESSEALQEVQVQHPPELVLQEEFGTRTRATILHAKGSRLRRIHAQVWHVYEQEKEMTVVIDKMIEELDNA
ncbi:hypothetical protein EDB89DRAFT_2071452 [Lactarius sanguifluus]|nr:hypothetical protein EDB89DRAFT_2071452 [Lactarius sanguifluus]